MKNNELILSDKIQNASFSFRTILLTLLSIIIGVSLEHFLEKTIKHLIPLNFNNLDTLFYAVNTFLILFLIWFDYLWAILFYQWNIRFKDSFLLFLIIIPQFFSFYFIKELDSMPRAWVWCVCYTALIGMFAYWNTYRQIKKVRIVHSKISDTKTDKNIKQLMCCNQVFCIISMIFVITMIFIFNPVLSYPIINNVVFPIFLLFFLIMKLFVSTRFVKILFDNNPDKMTLSGLFKFKTISNLLIKLDEDVKS